MTDSITPATEHVDVLIVGAGLSGIGAGYHLQTNLPGKSYTILEARDASGGTWDLFRFPGVRSDSDMFTLGYHFRPWRSSKAIGDGQSILDYIRETASAYGIDRRIRFNHRVVSAQWSTDDARWTVTAERTDTGETATFTAGFLFMCSGYYRYDQGYLPDFPGIDRFKGHIAHPQFWSDDVDYAGKRVVVIGSGATAVTMIPAMADDAEHVTMLQRSPSYIMSLPGRGPRRQAAGKGAPTQARVLDRALEERAVHDGHLPAQPAPAEGDEVADPQGAGEGAAGRLRPRRALQPQLRPVGSAHVPCP